MKKTENDTQWKCWDELPDLINTEMCAAYLGMKKGFICHEIRQNRLKALRIGHVYKIPKKSLRAYLDALENE